MGRTPPGFRTDGRYCARVQWLLPSRAAPATARKRRVLRDVRTGGGIHTRSTNSRLGSLLEIISGHDTRNTTRPLFLCYTSHLVHSPLQIMNETFRRFDFIAQSRTPDYEFHRQTIAAMAYYMDSVVGSMVGALQAKGMWNNTLWVHQSDNGGPSYTESLSNNFPLRVRRP